MKNLAFHDWKVDIIVTHDAPRSYAEHLGYDRDAMKANGYDHQRVNVLDFFDTLLKKVSFQDWFCGHYHIDYDLGSYHFLYQRILDAKEKTNAGVLYPEFQLGDKVRFAPKEGEKPTIHGIIHRVYPYGLGLYRYGYSDYDILCTDEQPFGKHALCKRIHEEWIVKEE